MDNNQDHLNVLRKIKNKPSSSQRELAKELEKLKINLQAHSEN